MGTLSIRAGSQPVMSSQAHVYNTIVMKVVFHLILNFTTYKQWVFPPCHILVLQHQVDERNGTEDFWKTGDDCEPGRLGEGMVLLYN